MNFWNGDVGRSVHQLVGELQPLPLYHHSHAPFEHVIEKYDALTVRQKHVLCFSYSIHIINKMETSCIRCGMRGEKSRMSVLEQKADAHYW